ncbi:MAG: hypothetical protein LC108_14210 [Anaerolineales bacterium]|nr:hypothetical protein [Anaerolineales bacterium]
MIEERDGKLHGYEMKWSASKKINAPTQWSEGYSNSSFEIISPENYQKFILP